MMASTSPSPNSPPVATAPASNTPLATQSSPLPGPPDSPPSQPDATSPTAAPPTPSAPSLSPPSTIAKSPPPVSLSPPPSQPPVASPPPPTAPPTANVPPPSSNPPPPPSPNLPSTSYPPASSPPPPSPSSNSPASSPPPPPPSSPPASSPPPPPSNPPTSSPPPPPPSSPPTSSPPPPSNPPTSSPPTPPSSPPVSSPPPPPSNPPASSSPLPSSSPPPSSPPSAPSSPPPRLAPLPPSTPPTSSLPAPPSSPTANSPPSPSSNPSARSPSPPSEPPKGSPPPSPTPPESSPPPTSRPPMNSPHPPSSEPPLSPPPRPASNPPLTSPPASLPPNRSAPPTVITPPSSDSSPGLSPPSPSIRLSPPPSNVSPTPPSPSQTSNSTPKNDSANAPDNSNSNGNGGIGTGGTVAIGLVLGLVLLGIFGTAAWCIWKRRKRVPGLNGGHVLPASMISSPRSDSALIKVQISAPYTGSGSGSNVGHSPSEPGGLGNSRSWFTYQELVRATDGFTEHNLLGEGGFGSVYKGCLADGRDVAVKQLKIGGGQGEREFKAEVEIISRIHHRHLVSLVGYCICENQRLLVYDYVPNNTLHFHLHGEGRPVMDWPTRVKIATGAARGIAYLHEDCQPRIIHRDIKSSNILLDDNFEARVSDFGLAKLALDTNTHITTRVMGTFGYMAPEYASSGKLTEKSDVYSFGVVLLELITGRKPVDPSQPLGDESLVEWSRPLLSHALDNEEFVELVDPRLETNYVSSEMFRMIEAAAACVRHLAAKRPSMGQIVRAFDSMGNSDLLNGMRVGESEVFNSAQQSEEIRLFRRMAFGIQDYSTDSFSQHSWSN